MNDPTTIDVLIYHFEQCLDEPMDFSLDEHERLLRGELREAGFSERAVSDAFAWLTSLTTLEEAEPAPGDLPVVESTGASSIGMRIYTPDEQEHLNTECRGLLYSLEYMGLLDAHARERVVDRAMALDAISLDVDALRWVVLVVLLNLPGRESTCDWVEEVLFASDIETAH